MKFKNNSACLALSSFVVVKKSLCFALSLRILTTHSVAAFDFSPTPSCAVQYCTILHSFKAKKMSLLPNHKSKFDKKFDELFGICFDSLDISVIDTLSSNCPSQLLPILAASFDADIDGLSEVAVRELIKNAFKIHYYSGTFYSLQKALSSFFGTAKVYEWHSYNGKSYHFKLELEATKQGISRESLIKTDEIVSVYKNVRSVYDGATIKLVSKTNSYVGAVNFIGEHITIYPYQIENISILTKEYIGGYVKLAEIITAQTLNLKGELR